MKLLRVIYSIDPALGGPIEGLKQSSHILDQHGVDTEIASFDAPQLVQSAIKELPWKVHAMGPATLGSYGYCPALGKWLNQHVQDYQAVIIHGNWQYHGLAASRACRKHNVPYFIFPHGMLDPWFNKTYPLKKYKKMLYWNWGEHPVLKHAQAVLFTCEQERHLARNSFKPYQVSEAVVGYGTKAPQKIVPPLEKDPQAAELPWGTSSYWLFMGRIQEKKGIDLLLAAYSNIRNQAPDCPDLVIAGPTQDSNYLDQLRTQYPQTGVHWTGHISGQLKHQALAEAQALILPSHQENFGLVVAEALASGTPVLISNKVNIWREIADAGAGIIAEDTIQGTTELLQKWLACSPTQRAALSEAARTVFAEHFDIEQASMRLLERIHESLQTYTKQ